MTLIYMHPWQSSRPLPSRSSDARETIGTLPNKVFASRNQTIYHVIFLLRKLTLPELVPPILDHAELWFSTTRKSHQYAVGVLPKDDRVCLLVHRPLTAPQCRRVRRITLSAKSLGIRIADDSLYRTDYQDGTRQWIVFDLQILPKDERKRYSFSPGHVPIPRAPDPQASFTLADAERVLRWDSPCEEDQLVLKRLKPENQLCVSAHLKFMGVFDHLVELEVKLDFAAIWF